jgi:outer membrane lipoprotein SlyB
MRQNDCRRGPRLIPILIAVLATACSARPVLYPNAHLTAVGKDKADTEIAECMHLADENISSRKAGQVAKSSAIGAGVGAAAGAAGGAVVGHAGRGAAVGAASGGAGGIMHGLFRASQPSPTYKNFVNHCLRERGYEPLGWE